MNLNFSLCVNGNNTLRVLRRYILPVEITHILTCIKVKGVSSGFIFFIIPFILENIVCLINGP